MSNLFISNYKLKACHHDRPFLILLSKMIVLKFGGSSIATPERMRHIAQIIQSQNESKKLVVLSAIAGITNDLEKFHHFLEKKDTNSAETQVDKIRVKHQDFIENLLTHSPAIQKAMSVLNASVNTLELCINSTYHACFKGLCMAQGEVIATGVFDAYLSEINQKAQLLYAPDFIQLNANDLPELKSIRKNIHASFLNFPETNLFITQGFICTDNKMELGNLQRGGSDYSASLFGAALQAQEIQIWTDIDGVHNNDPRFVKDTASIEHLSYEEAAELAYFGAKVLHPQTIHPARMQQIPVRLLNTLAPERPGTCISNFDKNKKTVAIAAKDQITAIRIQSSRMLLAFGFLKNIFEIFEKYKTAIDMITTSEVAVSLTIDSTDNLEIILEELQKFGHVEVDANQSIVCIVGDFSGKTHGKAAIITDALKHLPIRMISYGGSEHNISILLPEEHKIEALRSLHARLF